MRTTALIAALAILVVSMTARPEENGLKPQSPTDSMKELVQALAARDAQRAERSLISEAEYTRLLPVEAPRFPALLAKFRESVTGFLAQKQALEKMEFVRVNYRFCKEPMAAPKGYNGCREAFVLYDNIHITVRIDGDFHCFNVDALVPDGGRWALVQPIELLRPAEPGDL